MVFMKSQVIRIRNIPKKPRDYEKIINVKPLLLLIIVLIAGALITFFKPYLAVLGVSLMVLSLFCLTVMPDKDLIRFAKTYMILFNRHNRDECMMIYYDEVVSWHYEWYKNYDQVVIELIDGSTEIQEMYSLLAIKRTMDMYLPGKMKKESRWMK